MLYLVPTPIGNLQDITLRALETLKSVDFIVCEDTRHFKKLLFHYKIDKPLISFHDHSSLEKVKHLIDRISRGEKMAYVTDAGMPLISDPGFPLIREAIKQGIKVEALPGASAFVTALAASGLPSESFIFSGFLPPKTGSRKNKIKDLADRPETLIFYESPYKLVATLKDLNEVLGNREAVVAREISKMFEEYKRGFLLELISHYEKHEPKGEIVILVSGFDRKEVLH